MKTLTMTWRLVDENKVREAFQALTRVADDAYACVEDPDDVIGMAEQLIIMLDVYAMHVNKGKPVGWLDLGLER